MKDILLGALSADSTGNEIPMRKYYRF